MTAQLLTSSLLQKQSWTCFGTGNRTLEKYKKATGTNKFLFSSMTMPNTSVRKITNSFRNFLSACHSYFYLNLDQISYSVLPVNTCVLTNKLPVAWTGLFLLIKPFLRIHYWIHFISHVEPRGDLFKKFLEKCMKCMVRLHNRVVSAFAAVLWNATQR